MLNFGCQPCSLYSEDFFCSSLKLFGSILIAYVFIARRKSGYNNRKKPALRLVFLSFILFSILLRFILSYLFQIAKYKFVFDNLAVPYSHMGMPHTTIGITAFHF